MALAEKATGALGLVAEAGEPARPWLSSFFMFPFFILLFGKRFLTLPFPPARELIGLPHLAIVP